MPKFAPRHGDTIHTADNQQYVCQPIPPRPHEFGLGYMGSTIYGRLAGLVGWQVWNDEGLPVKYDGTVNTSSRVRITHITPKESNMPVFTPKFGDTITTKNGDRYTCIEKPSQYLAEYAPGTIFGVMGIPGGTRHMAWDRQGRPDDGIGVVPNSVDAIASVETPEKPKKFNPQPWDTVVTYSRGCWTCCTQAFLQEMFGLATGSMTDRLFAFRAENVGKGSSAVEWMSWPDSLDGIAGEWQITKVIQARCNRPAIRGRWNRAALIEYIETLPESFGIDKHGHIE